MHKRLAALDQQLYHTPNALLEGLRRLPGDIMLLGAGGKMGPSLARLARLAIDRVGLDKRVIAVSRFRDGAQAQQLNQWGVETIAADLLDERQLGALPKVENIIYLVGHKFGATGNAGLTWALNSYLPGRVAATFPASRIVAFSTGNVYPFVPVGSGGASEADPPGPVGEYAQSCLGRERLFEYFSQKNGTPVLIYRLNYAIDLRYGVLMDIARAVAAGQAIDLTMGHVNVIWQGDANQIALRALHHAASPPRLLNVTGVETLSVRDLARRFGELLGRAPLLVGTEAPTALLSNSRQMQELFGPPSMPVEKMLRLTAEWLQAGGDLLDKPTHFQERSGKF